MATSKDLKNQLTEQNNQAVDVSKLGFKTAMSHPAIKRNLMIFYTKNQMLSWGLF